MGLVVWVEHEYLKHFMVWSMWMWLPSLLQRLIDVSVLAVLSTSEIIVVVGTVCDAYLKYNHVLTDGNKCPPSK